GAAAGQMQVTSYRNVGPAQLHVTFMGARDNDHPGTKNNIVYAYVNDNAGGGDLDFAVHNTTSQDRFSAHSRWKNDGRGRADVAGLGSGYNVSLSECWGAAPFNVTYFSSNVKVVVAPWGGPDAGSAGGGARGSAGGCGAVLRGRADAGGDRAGDGAEPADRAQAPARVPRLRPCGAGRRDAGRRPVNLDLGGPGPGCSALRVRRL